jgi:hypothetical protein
MSADKALSPVLIAFLDANIVLEGKSIQDLPWEEVTKEGLIRALIVPKAMEEIDSKKRDGRLGPHARAFNRLIANSVIDGKAIIVREGNPRVELQMATCSRIPWDEYDELDPNDGDSRIVAEALHVRDTQSSQRVLISHDIKPLAYARGRGLSVYQASDDWLRPVEASPKDKEIQRLRSEVAEYRKDEPTFKISIEISDIEPPVVYRITPLESEQVEALEKAIKAKNPKKANGRGDNYGFMFGGEDRDSSYDDKYRTFIDKIVPDFAERFDKKMELLFNQRLLTIRVLNAGKIRADHLVVSVTTNDGWINRRIVAVSPSGPAAPVPRPDYLRNLNMHHNFLSLPPSVGRHEFETTLRPERSHEMEAICEDFRSGQEYRFSGVIAVTSDAKPLVITVALTAANLRGKQTENVKIQKQIVSIGVCELVDMSQLTLKQDYFVKRQMEHLLATRAYDEIEWDDQYTPDR